MRFTPLKVVNHLLLNLKTALNSAGAARGGPAIMTPSHIIVRKNKEVTV